MDKRLYRSTRDVLLGGVCGGLAQYLGIPVLLVRAFFILFALTNGLGVLVYLLLWLIVPRDDLHRRASLHEVARSAAGEIAEHARNLGDDLRQAVIRPNPQARIFIGASLLLTGIFYLLQQLDLPWLRWLDPNLLWPALLILAGLALLLRHPRDE